MVASVDKLSPSPEMRRALEAREGNVVVPAVTASFACHKVRHGKSQVVASLYIVGLLALAHSYESVDLLSLIAIGACVRTSKMVIITVLFSVLDISS